MLFPSIFAQTLYIRGNELIGGNRAGLFINLVPIFGTLLSIVILREAFFTYHAVALFMVLGGICWQSMVAGNWLPELQAAKWSLVSGIPTLHQQDRHANAGA